MSPCCIFAWPLAGMMATPPVEVERALRDAPTVTLDARVDASKMAGHVIAAPRRDQMPGDFNEQLVVEFYSR